LSEEWFGGKRKAVQRKKFCGEASWLLLEVYELERLSAVTAVQLANLEIELGL